MFPISKTPFGKIICFLFVRTASRQISKSFFLWKRNFLLHLEKLLTNLMTVCANALEIVLTMMHVLSSLAKV